MYFGNSKTYGKEESTNNQSIIISNAEEVNVDEIIQKGLWGTGEERKKNLENAGYDYNAIQKIINKKL